jgi:Pyruvate/2-oxoacid:ferredoxin oxidoreductase delta subunit
MFGSHADYYVENKLGRYISREEALAVLDTCEKAGLVNQPANMINPGGMCNCCGDCCGLLRTLNKMPKPALVVFSNYYAAIDPDLCTVCELCLTRCQMAAISINDDQVAVINKDRCIGCGLCVTECSTQAIVLTLKSQEQQNIPPANAFELMEQTSKIRGTTLIPLSTRLDK